MPVGATIGAAGIGAGASLIGTNKAAKASKDATNASLALQQKQFDQTQANLAPYQQAGQTGLNALTSRVNDPSGGTYGDATNPTAPTAPGNFSYTASDYHSSPGYQFQLQQGLNAIQSSQAARGALGSGATLKALQTYGQGVADQDFNQERAAAQSAYGVNQQNYTTALNQYNNDRNYLTGQYNTQTQNAGNLATIGANAAAGANTAGLNFANNSGNLLTQNAQTTGQAALVNAGNTNSLIGQGLNTYLNRSGLVNNLVKGAANNTQAYTPGMFTTGAGAPSSGGFNLGFNF